MVDERRTLPSPLAMVSERAADRHECLAAVAAAAFNAAIERGGLGLIARGQVGRVLGSVS